MKACFSSPCPWTFLILVFNVPTSISNIKTIQVLPGFLRLLFPFSALCSGCSLLPSALVLLLLFKSGQEPGDELVPGFVGGNAALLLLLLLAVFPLQPDVPVGGREELVHRLDRREAGREVSTGTKHSGWSNGTLRTPTCPFTRL